MEFEVSLSNGGDTTVDIEVSEKSIKAVQRFLDKEDNEGLLCDSGDLEEHLPRVHKEIADKIREALAEQVEDDEDIDVDSLDFGFCLPDELITIN